MPRHRGTLFYIGAEIRIEERRKAREKRAAQATYTHKKSRNAP